MSVFSLLGCLLISVVSGLIVSACVSFLIVSIMLNKSNRIGSSSSGFDDFTKEPLHMIRKEDILD